jgi:signal transduction histidine kinase
VRSPLSFLASRRLVGVGLALVAECSLVAAFTLAPAPVEAGIPGVVSAAIAGTVAVVFGVLDGVVLAVIGAVVFGAVDGWSVGAAAALVVWPGVVGAVGLFARRVEQRRDLFRLFVSEQEGERRRLAIELHDEKAQVLAGALMMLRAAGSSTDDTSTATAKHARELISETITALRTLAGDLSPRTLEHHGLAASLEQLATTLSSATGVIIRFEHGWGGRLPPETELALYRVVQDTLAALIDDGEREMVVTLERGGDTVIVAIEPGGGHGDIMRLAAAHGQHERLRLLGGRVRLAHMPGGGRRLQAEVPVHPRRQPEIV